MQDKESNRIAIALKEIDDLKDEVRELQDWRSSCNKWLAGWGSICMFVTSCGYGLIHYYYDIKSFLIAFWGIKS